MNRIVYETNIGRWPLMTRKWPANQRIKCVDYLADRLRNVRRNYGIAATHTFQVWNANATQGVIRLWEHRPSETQMRLKTRPLWLPR